MKIALALMGVAGLAFSATATPSYANTINIFDGTTLRGTLSDGTSGTTFEAFSGTSLNSASLSSTSASLFTVNSSPANEAAALDTLLGSNVFSTTNGSSNDTTNSGSSVTFSESGQYFLLKMGGGNEVAYFYDSSNSVLNLTFTQNPAPRLGRGLSHTADFGTITAAVPEPSTWAMMMFGFAGISLLLYRKKQSVRFA